MRNKFLPAQLIAGVFPFLFLASLVWGQPNKFEFSTIPTITAGEPFYVCITAIDSITGDTLSWDHPVQLSVDGDGNVLYPNSVTLANGIWDDSIEVYRAGSAVLIASSSFSGYTVRGESNSFTVLQGLYKRLQVLLEGEQPAPGNLAWRGRQWIPKYKTAGEPETLTVRATDAYWNLKDHVPDSFSITSTDPFVQGPLAGRLVNGIDSVIVYPRRATEDQDISFETKFFVTNITTPDKLPDTSSLLTVNCGPYAKLILIAPGETHCPGEIGDGKSGIKDLLYTGQFNTFQVYGTDNCWNLNPNAVDLVRIDSCLGSLPPDSLMPTDSLLANGKASFEVCYNQYGPKNLQAIGLISGFHSACIEVNVGLGIYKIIVPDTIRASAPFPLTIVYQDATGDTISANHVFYLKACGIYFPAAGSLTIKSGILTDGLCYIGNEHYNTDTTELIKIAAWDDFGSDTSYSSYPFTFVWYPKEDITIDPNPFGALELGCPAKITFYLPEGDKMTIRIYDPFGNLVREFSDDEIQNKGSLHPYVEWYGKNDKGWKVGSGVYHLCIRVTSGTEVLPIMRAKIAVIW
ncbi:hypothetical protein KAW65_05300 [candidate division WOR-3 bacterium]|nr:hypothetical protein [candidate division WOR-3 bacterium]